MASVQTTGPSCQVVTQLTISPTSMTTTYSVQTFTLNGLLPSMNVVTDQIDAYVQAGVAIVASYCNVANVLTLVFTNMSGGTYNPAASQSLGVIAI